MVLTSKNAQWPSMIQANFYAVFNPSYAISVAQYATCNPNNYIPANCTHMYCMKYQKNHSLYISCGVNIILYIFRILNRLMKLFYQLQEELCAFHYIAIGNLH